jgi:hypothetical protein
MIEVLIHQVERHAPYMHQKHDRTFHAPELHIEIHLSYFN